MLQPPRPHGSAGVRPQSPARLGPDALPSAQHRLHHSSLDDPCTCWCCDEADRPARCTAGTLTGRAPAQIDDNSKRIDYRGKLRNLIHGASDAPHGGQILLAGSEAFDGIKTRLPELLTLVPATPDYPSLETQARHALALNPVSRASNLEAGLLAAQSAQPEPQSKALDSIKTCLPELLTLGPAALEDPSPAQARHAPAPSPSQQSLSTKARR